VEDLERFYGSGANAINRNSKFEYRNSKQIRNPNAQMSETNKGQMKTTRRQQELYIYVFGVFGFGSFEFVSDFVLRI
jgi:hypothetical protein